MLKLKIKRITTYISINLNDIKIFKNKLLHNIYSMSNISFSKVHYTKLQVVKVRNKANYSKIIS